MKQEKYTLRKTNYKFNSADDFIDWKISFNCDENRDRFLELIRKFCSELTVLVEEDQRMAGENADNIKNK